MTVTGKQGLNKIPKRHKNPFINDIIQNPLLYIMLIPMVIFYILFCYVPMYGAIIAFKDFTIGKGIIDSPWTSMWGFGHFIDFIKGPFFGRTFGNTLTLSLGLIICAFPAPIIFAVLLNEIKNPYYKRTIQTVTYIPHFISVMVVCGLLYTFLGRDGFINDIIVMFGGKRSNLLANPDYFKPIFIISDIWQQLGWDSIIYLSAMVSIDQGLYEAASIDGAGRFRRIIHVTLPGIIPTIVTLFILRMGGIFTIGYEKIILLYNDMTYESADVISSFVYRRGLLESDYSYSTAVGLFNSILNFIVLCITNAISRRVSETSLW